jgi:hypothetical protein
MFDKLLSLLPSLHGTRGIVYLSIAVSVFGPTIVVAYLVRPQDFQSVDLPHLLLIAAATGGASLLMAATGYLLLELGSALGNIGRMLRAGQVPDELTRKANSPDALARTSLSLSGFGSLSVQGYAAFRVVALHLGLDSFIAGVFMIWWQIAPYLGIFIAASVAVGLIRFILGRRAVSKRGLPVTG